MPHFFSYSQEGSTGIPPDESRVLGKPLPDITLIDSYGNTFHLYSLKGKPIILSPIYTKCQSACPLITDSLKKVIPKLGVPGRDFWVLSFSFDPSDTVEDLKRFQMEHQLDGVGWKVVKPVSREELFRFLDAIDFRFMTTDNGRDFVHPNLVLIVSPDMRALKFAYGVVFKEEDLKPEPKGPTYLFFFALAGFIASGLYLTIFLAKRRPSRR